MAHNVIHPDEVFENEYFILNKKMLRLITLWPYQKASEKICVRIYLIITVSVLMMPQLIRLIEEFLNEDANIEIILENISGFCFFLALIAKFVMSLQKESNLQYIYEEITKDWKDIRDEGESNVLRRYASSGRFLTIVYTVYAYLSCVLYASSTAVIPILLNSISTREEPFKKALCIYAEYFIDQDKYFYQLFCIILVSAFSAMAIFTGIDCTFVNCVQHILGLFHIIKYRLESLNDIVSNPVKYNAKDIDKIIHKNVMYCGKIHNRCLKFIAALQKVYNACFFFLTVILIFGIAIFSVDLMMNIDRPINFLRIFTLWIGSIIYLFYVSWPGQKLIDANNELFTWLYASGWYQFPLESKNHIRFIMMRVLRPCHLTAGPLLVMNFQTCSLVLRSAFSYFTAVTSMK